MGLANTDEEMHIFDNLEIDSIINDCEKYRSRLINYCLKSFSFDYATSQDTVQNAYVALYENLLGGVKIENYKAWLYRVTFYFADKAAKEAKKRNECELTSNLEISDDSAMTIEDKIDNKNMESDLQVNEAALSIISKLKQNERELYMMYYCENKKLKDIAEKLNVSEITLRKRHSRLKKKLKSMIDEVMER